MDFWQRQEKMFSIKENQELREMVVMIAGVGGLGTHQAQELQRIGVKKIYLFDFDQIAPSNLNRQVFYGYSDLGEHKHQVAKNFLDTFQLGTIVEARGEKINNNSTIPSDVDIVFDALDNINSRLILEGLAAQANIPLIHGGINSWYGQITSIIPGKTKQLRELYQNITEQQEKIPAISPLVAVVASLQVIEGVKVYLDHDELLTNRLLIIDARNYSLEIIQL